MRVTPHYDRVELARLMNGNGVVHPKYGNLLAPDCVVMPQPTALQSYREYKPYYIHLSVTGRCNARCEGCINSSITDKDAPFLFEETVPERDAKAIVRLVENIEKKDVIICLYGGEPLLRPGKIITLIDELDRLPTHKHFRYMLYTNGQLLDKVIDEFPELLSRMWLVSVSIDGTREQHNAVRPGTDLQVIERNLELLRDRFDTHVLMWSTLRERMSLFDCYSEFFYLFMRGLVDQFFWHWMEAPEPFVYFQEYMERYESDLRHILEDYRAFLETGFFLPITHINELLLYFLTGKKRGSTSCGVELQQHYDIKDGHIHACADLSSEFTIGAIHEDGTPEIRERDLSPLIEYKKDIGCYHCGVEAYCGGRCPVQAIISKAERLVQYCQLMRLHVSIVKEYFKDIKPLIENAGFDLQDMYDQSVMFNQFTDVTP